MQTHICDKSGIELRHHQQYKLSMYALRVADVERRATPAALMYGKFEAIWMLACPVPFNLINRVHYAGNLLFKFREGIMDGKFI